MVDMISHERAHARHRSDKHGRSHADMVAFPTLRRYCAWVSELQDPSEPLLDFQRWLAESEEDEDGYSEPEAKPPPKKARKVTLNENQADDGSPLVVGQCIICCDRPVKVIFKQCGHLNCCARCGAKCNACPVCRVQVREGAEMRVYAS